MSVRNIIATVPVLKENYGRALEEIYSTDADEVLASLRAAGYTVVPVEPTLDMVRDGCAVECKECHMDCKSGPYTDIYRAMIAAAEKEMQK